jgi:hypothetical protein
MTSIEHKRILPVVFLFNLVLCLFLPVYFYSKHVFVTLAPCLYMCFLNKFGDGNIHLGTCMIY